MRARLANRLCGLCSRRDLSVYGGTRYFLLTHNSRPLKGAQSNNNVNPVLEEHLPTAKHDVDTASLERFRTHPKNII